MFLDDFSTGDFICCDCQRRWDLHSRCVLRIGEEVRPVCRECFSLATGQEFPKQRWPKSPVLFGLIRGCLFAATIVACVMIGALAAPLLLLLFGLNSAAGRAAL
jgi:hypothetical protein